MAGEIQRCPETNPELLKDLPAAAKPAENWPTETAAKELWLETLRRKLGVSAAVLRTIPVEELTWEECAALAGHEWAEAPRGWKPAVLSRLARFENHEPQT